MIESILNSLGFSRDDTKIYLFLLKTGAMSAGVLAKKLGIPRSSLYGFLSRLQQQGLLVESQKRGVKIFTAENPAKINLLFSQKIENLQKYQEQFKAELPALKNSGEKLINPKFQIFEGGQALQNALKDMLLYYNLETQAFWPQRRMVEVLTSEFFRYHNKERIRNNLSVRAVWPQSEIVEIKKYPYFGIGEKFKREIRIAPELINTTMGYWVYGNKTVLVSSTRENFGFIVESLEFAEMLKTQFEVLWKLSTQIKIDPRDTDQFIRELERYT